LCRREYFSCTSHSSGMADIRLSTNRKQRARELNLIEKSEVRVHLQGDNVLPEQTAWGTARNDSTQIAELPPNPCMLNLFQVLINERYYLVYVANDVALNSATCRRGDECGMRNRRADPLTRISGRQAKSQPPSAAPARLADFLIL
jgi:hypothetical protein